MKPSRAESSTTWKHQERNI